MGLMTRLLLIQEIVKKKRHCKWTIAYEPGRIVTGMSDR
jgi:hypothetical protein